MKTKSLLLIVVSLLLSVSCTKKTAISQKETVSDKAPVLIETWVEKYPEMFDGISDTLVFRDDSIVKKHFYFKDWKYLITRDSISFKKDAVVEKFSYSFKDSNEIVIYNFVDRLITQEVKDIYFTKIN